MNEREVYSIAKSIGTFADESAFKKKFVKIINDESERYKTALEIENSVEPGMPDIILVDMKDRSSFIETKYARKGVITFKKSQIPWYRRHRNLNIIILAYNDKTTNVHVIDTEYILRSTDSVSFRLREENDFMIEENL